MKLYDDILVLGTSLVQLKANGAVDIHKQQRQLHTVIWKTDQKNWPELNSRLGLIPEMERVRSTAAMVYRPDTLPISPQIIVRLLESMLQLWIKELSLGISTYKLHCWHCRKCRSNIRTPIRTVDSSSWVFPSVSTATQKRFRLTTVVMRTCHVI